MDETQVNIEEMLRKSTVRDDLPISVNGSFPSQEAAQELLNTVMGFAKIFGSVFDLNGLDGITIADDYVAALNGVDRGYPDMKGPTPTNDVFGAGFAMAVPVLRDGVHKSHVVLNSALIRPIVDPENQFYGLAVHTLCHEMAHVYDHMLRSKALPGLYGSQMTDLREAVLMQLAMGVWDEYAASRLSAHWGTPDYCSGYEESLLPMLETILSRSEAAKKDFANHRNVERAMSELREILGTFFVRASYLTGHTDGLGRPLEEEAPKLAAALRQTTWFNTIWTRGVNILREMFDKIESWEGLEAYVPLKDLFEEMYLRGGMKFVKLPDGRYFVQLMKTASL
jgi:hypothetical protein